jgi:3-phenylpropionate/trans-cinnamate dioxygenase ferredoxin subunit
MAYQEIAKLSSIEEGKIYSFQTKYKDIALVKKGSEFFAFEDICSHDGGTISEGEISEDKVICPRHFAEFSLKTGDALTMPATESIATFPVRVVGDRIEVDWED